MLLGSLSSITLREKKMVSRLYTDAIANLMTSIKEVTCHHTGAVCHPRDVAE